MDFQAPPTRLRQAANGFREGAEERTTDPCPNAKADGTLAHVAKRIGLSLTVMCRRLDV